MQLLLILYAIFTFLVKCSQHGDSKKPECSYGIQGRFIIVLFIIFIIVNMSRLEQIQQKRVCRVPQTYLLLILRLLHTSSGEKSALFFLQQYSLFGEWYVMNMMMNSWCSFSCSIFFPLHSRRASLVVSSVFSQHEHPGFESCSKIVMPWSQHFDPLIQKIKILPACFFHVIFLDFLTFNLLSHSQWLVSLVPCFLQSFLVFLISL